jgi:hypothetical protein
MERWLDTETLKEETGNWDKEVSDNADKYDKEVAENSAKFD